MKKRTRPTYSPEFRLEVAQQVVDEQRSVRDVADAMGLGKSTVDKWARQLKEERNGNLTSATPLTPDQLKIRELERKLKRLEEDNEILKKASALLMQDSIKGFRWSATFKRDGLYCAFVRSLKFSAVVTDTGLDNRAW